MSVGILAGGLIGAMGMGAANMGLGLGMTMFSAISLGFTLGSAIGSYIDPIASDTNGLGSPQNSKIDITTCEEGDPIPDLIGISKLSGNVIGYWRPRTEEVRSGGKGGKGGSNSKKEGQVTGYKYYLTWAVMFCEGPVDAVEAIWADTDTCVWKGPVYRPSAGAGGYQTIVIPEVGTCRFYFGTSDHQNESRMDCWLADPTLNPSYRHFAYAFFDDCCVGPAQKMPTMSFVIRKTPSALTTDLVDVHDYNPASGVYYILNSKLGVDSSLLDSTSFEASNSVLLSMIFGINMLMDQYQPATAYIESLLSHMDGLLTFQNDGKFHLDLNYQSETTASLPEIIEDYMVEPLTLTRKSWLDTTSEIKIQYPKRVNVSTDPETSPLTLTGLSEVDECGIYQYTASGGCPPYTWSVSGSGASAVTQTGSVTVVGGGDFTVTVTDYYGTSCSM